MGDVLAPVPRSSFLRYWTAAAISSFGSAVTAVAMPVLVVQRLDATPLEVGVVNAVRRLPTVRKCHLDLDRSARGGPNNVGIHPV